MVMRNKKKNLKENFNYKDKIHNYKYKIHKNQKNLNNFQKQCQMLMK